MDFLNLDFGGIFTALVLITIALLLIRSIRIIPQATAGVVERLGRYHKTLNAGVNLVFPFIDVVRRTIDLREQVVDFQPQSVITEDNLVISIDTVIYYQVTDPKSATYEIANFVLGIEQLTVTTLRNKVGSLDLEDDGLGLSLCSKNLCLLVSLGCEDVGLLLTLGNQDCSTLVALCLHLLFHGLAD